MGFSWAFSLCTYALQPAPQVLQPTLLHRRTRSPAAALRRCDAAAEEFIAEMNMEHAEELRRLVQQKNDADGVDWSVEKMESVRLMAVDDEAMHLEEVRCKTSA